MRRLTAGIGVLAAFGAGVLVGTPTTVLAASVLGAVAALSVDRGTSGLAVASLALAAATLLVVEAMAAASGSRSAIAALAVAGGLAGCLTAATGGGRLDTVLGGWTAMTLLPAAWGTAHVATSPAAASLVGSRLAWLGLPSLVVAAPIAVAAVAASGALARWREAGLPPWLCTFGPAIAVVGTAWIAMATTPDFGALASGSLLAAPVAYTTLVAGAIVIVASLLAGAVAAADPRFRRMPAWLALAVGPLCLAAAVSIDGGGVVLGALTTVPSLGDPFGAIAETASPPLARSLLASVTISTLAVGVVVIARGPVLRRLTAGRPAAVGAGSLLVAVAMTDLPVGTTVIAGGLALLGGLLLVAPPAVEPPPRTALARVPIAVGATAVGGLIAVGLVSVVPDPAPGIGGVLVLSGVAILAVALR